MAPVASITADREMVKAVPAAGRTLSADLQARNVADGDEGRAAGADPATDPAASRTSRTETEECWPGAQPKPR